MSEPLCCREYLYRTRQGEAAELAQHQQRSGEDPSVSRHTGEGDVYGSHWIVVHCADRAADGSVLGFWIIDSSSTIEYLTAEELSNIYYGHDGTTILDPSCIEVFGWKYRTLVTTGE